MLVSVLAWALVSAKVLVSILAMGSVSASVSESIRWDIGINFANGRMASTKKPESFCRKLGW